MRAAREARFTTDEIHHIRGGVTHLHTYVVVAQGGNSCLLAQCIPWRHLLRGLSVRPDGSHDKKRKCVQQCQPPLEGGTKAEVLR